MTETIVKIRAAARDDSRAIESLIRRSSRMLGAADYSPQQIEAALTGAWGLDTRLIDDGTFFVAETAGKIIGCGGWSWRRALCGGDELADRDASALDPNTEPARIRAFFVDPAFARTGIASKLLDHCEAEARRHGFGALMLGATIPGRRFYESRGYETGSIVDFECAPGVDVPIAVMTKRLRQ